MHTQLDYITVKFYSGSISKQETEEELIKQTIQWSATTQGQLDWD